MEATRRMRGTVEPVELQLHSVKCALKKEQKRHATARRDNNRLIRKLAAAILFARLCNDGLLVATPTDNGPEYRLSAAGRAALRPQ